MEAELKQGEMVAILFWNPRSAVDETVHRELQLLQAVHHGLRKYSNNPVVRRLLKAVGLELDSKLAVHDARASPGRIVRLDHSRRAGLPDADDPDRQQAGPDDQR